MRNFQAHHLQVIFKPKKNGSHSPNFKIKTDSVTEKPNLWSICRAWKCKRRLKMFWISLLKLGFTLKEIDLSVFSSLQRHFLHLPDFLLFSRASAPAKRAQRSPIRIRKLKPIDPKKKVQSKADHKKLILRFHYSISAEHTCLLQQICNIQDRRPPYLQLISFSNLSMPENLVMTSEYSDYPYRP